MRNFRGKMTYGISTQKVMRDGVLMVVQRLSSSQTNLKALTTLEMSLE